jgi:tetratricopeptide (TPR) repeat protein
MIHKRGLLGVMLALLAPAMMMGQLRAEKQFASYPQAARDRFIQADEMLDQKRYPEAAAAYEEAGKLGLEDYPKIYLRQADCYKQMGQHARVVAAYTWLIDELGVERSCRTCIFSALRGRSAAYEALGDMERALNDLTTVVMLLEQDLSVRREMKAGELTELVQETAKAHRDRAQFLKNRSRLSAMRADVERADELERQTVGKTTETSSTWIRLVNDWDRVITVEVDGEVHELQPGKDKKWRRKPGAFSYTVREVGIPVNSSAKEGQMTTIRIYPPKR